MTRYERGQPTYEGAASFFLKTKDVTRGLRLGMHGKRILTFEWGRQMPFRLAIEVDTRNSASPFIRLTHERRNNPTIIEERYEVRLLTTSQPQGGLRWWFACPNTGQRATCLLLPNGGHRFSTRHFYRLAYASQREGPMGRASLQGMKLYAKLGGKGHWMDGPPPKPKRMHWKTYLREARRLVGYIDAFHEAWLPGAQRLLDRIDKKRK